VAIGAGWQAAVAYVNIACYYLFGIPVGLILGYKVDLGVKVSHIPLPSIYVNLKLLISCYLIIINYWFIIFLYLRAFTFCLKKLKLVA
jgi:MATE family multidrug resistance protein